VAEAEGEQEAASAALLVAVDALEAMRQLERRHAAAEQVVVRLTGEANTARANLAAAEQALAQLDVAERDRVRRAAHAAEVPDLERAVAAHDAERERARTAAEAHDRRRKAEGALVETSRRLANGLAAVPGGGAVDGWVWTSADAANPRRGALRLLDIVAGLEIEEACDRFANLSRCQLLIGERTEARRKLVKFVEVRRGLDEERRRLLSDGDPREAQGQARAERNAAMEEVAVASAIVQSARAEADRADRIAGNLRGQRLDEPCPTCDRPFDADEIKTTLAALERLRTERQGEADRARAVERAARERAASAQAREQALGNAIESLANVEGRIERSQSYLTEAEADVEAKNRGAADALAECGLTAEPTAGEVDEARRWAALLQQVEQTRGLLAAQA
jgi:hypothetical protein